MSFVILAVFLLSGFAGLSYEIVWIKKLSLIFGVSSHAISSVVAAYMAGLALGSYLFGRLSDRRKPDLWIYALLEGGIAASAFLLQLLLPLIDYLYIWMTQTFSHLSVIFIVVRFLLCFLGLLIPTTLMGATLPVISKFFITGISRVGNRVGLLYSCNTVGGVLGCILTGFVLLRYVGAQSTTWIAMGMNILAAVAALAIAFYYKSLDQDEPLKTEEAPTPDKKKGLRQKRFYEMDPRSFKRLLVIVYGIAGFASIAYEVLWTRVLVYILGNDIYAFTTILATFLIGIALGSFLFAYYADKNKNLVLTFGLIQFGIGFSSALLLSVLGKWFLNGASLHVYLNFFKSFILIFIPTFLMGAAFPIIIKMYTTHLNELGEDVGNIYAVNTIGGIFGSLIAGFIILPVLGAQKGIILLACVSTLLGIIVLCTMPISIFSRKKTSLIALASIAAIVVSALTIKPTVVYSKAIFENNLREILYYDESAEASLTVLRGRYNNRGLNINGETTAYSEYHDLLVHKMLAHVPILLTKNPQNALVIGFGLGSTAYSFSLHPIKRIDCAELVPKERETAQFFTTENHDIFKDPRFNFIAADGRNYLKTCRVKYDVISMNAIHPKNSPYLYTREFYQLCKSKLSDQGVMCAWLPSNTPYFASLIKTFQSVFPHTSMWFCNTGHMVLIGTPHRLQIDFKHWQKELSQEKVKADLADLLLDDPVKLISTMILAEDSLAHYTRQSIIQTDDLPKIEFEYFSDESKNVIKSNLDGALKYGLKAFDYITNIGDDGAAKDLKYRLDLYHEAMREAPDGLYFVFSNATPEQVMESMDKAVSICPENLGLLYDYNYMLASWLLSNPGQILSNSDYLTKTEEVRRRLLSRYEAILGKEYRPTAEIAVAHIRLAEAMTKYFEKDFTKARELAEQVLKVDPSSELANKIYSETDNPASGQ